MSDMIRIHLILPTAAHYDVVSGLKHLEEEGIELTQSHLDKGTVSVESEFDEAFAAPGMIEQAMLAEKGGVDAVVFLCVGDPGLAAAREALDIPVLGVGQTSMLGAALLAHKFSILPTLDRRIATYEDKVRHYGIESRLASVRPTNIPVTEIEKDQKAALAKLTALAISAVKDDHAGAIVLGCAGFQDMDKKMMQALKQATGLHIPVFDTTTYTIRQAAVLVRQGLSHSKASFPPRLDKKVIGYDV